MEKMPHSPIVEHFPATHTTQSFSEKPSHMRGFTIFTGIRGPCEQNSTQKVSPEKKPWTRTKLFLQTWPESSSALAAIFMHPPRWICSRPISKRHPNQQPISRNQHATEPQQLSKSSSLYSRFLHPHLPPFLFNLDKENANGSWAANAARAGSLLLTVWNDGLEAICFPTSFHMGSPAASGAVPPPPVPSPPRWEPGTQEDIVPPEWQTVLWRWGCKAHQTGARKLTKLARTRLRASGTG